MRILGIDPGFAKLGWCLAEYDGNAPSVLHMGVLETTKDTRKVLACVDNVRRAQEIRDGLMSLTALYVDVFCAEAMSFPRNASSAAKVAMAWGVIASVAQDIHVPIVQVSPQQIKVATTGSLKASKVRVGQELCRMCPEIVSMLEPLAVNKREHPIDALGAIVAALGSEVIKMGLRVDQKS